MEERVETVEMSICMRIFHTNYIVHIENEVVLEEMLVTRELSNII